MRILHKYRILDVWKARTYLSHLLIIRTNSSHVWRINANSSDSLEFKSRMNLSRVWKIRTYLTHLWRIRANSLHMWIIRTNIPVWQIRTRDMWQIHHKRVFFHAFIFVRSVQIPLKFRMQIPYPSPRIANAYLYFCQDMAPFGACTTGHWGEHNSRVSYESVQ